MSAGSGRPLREVSELGRIQDFNGRAIAAVGHAGYLHPGDIVHRVFSGSRHFDPLRVCRIWEDDAGIAAWTLLAPRQGSLELQLRPGRRGGRYEVDLLQQAETVLRRLIVEVAAPPELLETDAFVDDTVRIAALETAGWRRGENPYYLTRRPVAPPPPALLPAGYSLRTAQPAEAAAVGELHATAFGSSWEPGEYATLMDSFGYDSEREWLATGPDGELAAFAVTWHDQISGLGLFEPVGTHPDHRRRGLGRALMAQGLAAMKAAGMHTGTVTFAGSNPAARELYLRSGFEIAHEKIDYTKPW